MFANVFDEYEGKKVNLFVSSIFTTKKSSKVTFVSFHMLDHTHPTVAVTTFENNCKNITGEDYIIFLFYSV